MSLASALSALSTPAATASTAGTALEVESVRAMTWNICGEAGGSLPTEDDAHPDYCPFRNAPQTKADAIADVVAARGLNAVLLQEVCAGPADSVLGRLQAKLDPAVWHFVTAEVKRPDGTSNCRGALTGTVSVAIGVKGTFDGEPVREPLPVPNPGFERAQTLCAGVVGWRTKLCTTHLTNAKDMPAGTYAKQVEAVRARVAQYPWVVLGGDFNTSYQPNLKPLFDLMPECDAKSYALGDAANEDTQFHRTPSTGPWQYESVKIDYLFGRAGFTGCDSWTQMADQALYSGTVTTPTGISDHTPLYGYTRGVPQLAWGLHDASGTTAADTSGHDRTGTLGGGAAWGAERGGSVALDGTGTVSAAGPVVSTNRSFSLSLWAKVAPGAGTGAVASQDGGTTSGFILWYDAGAGNWRFGMPTEDTAGWHIDQAYASTTTPAGVWTHLAGTFDAASGKLTLYVDGKVAATQTHTALWAASGPFVIGRDLVSGNRNAYFKGSVSDVAVFDHPLTAAEVAALGTA